MAAPLIVGNWKMNGLKADLRQALAIAEGVAAQPATARVALCPAATLVAAMAQALAGTPVAVGGQDCHPERSGAFTGEISAEMLADAGASLVIVGHSERRTLFGETDALVAAKAEAARRAGLTPIVCVGETLAQRNDGSAIDVVCGQVTAAIGGWTAAMSLAVAYEPVWAIGAGQTPSLAQIEEMHAAIRTCLAGLGEVPILYGGSVKPSNATEILAAREVGGALVGGASLTAADFLPIVQASALPKTG
jgi:triosephosphate isomerase